MQNKSNKYNFYFTHNSFLGRNAIRILQDGYIRLGSKLPRKYRVLSGYEPMDEIYGNIYFDDLIKNQKYWGTMFVIHPNIMENYDIGFHFGWQGKEIILNNSKTKKIYWNRIDKAHEHIKLFKKKYVTNSVGFHRGIGNSHEIVFRKKIPIRKYVQAIVCDFCSPSEYKKIQKIVKEKNYKFPVIRQIGESSGNILTTKQLNI